MKFGSAVVLFLGLANPLLFGQSVSLTVTSAILAIGSGNGDSYSLEGTFAGVSIGASRTVSLRIGQFAASLLVSDLVQQPGTNIFVYQDSTGQTPYWLSSLTLDLDQQTFSATATGIVLAGLTNPFAVQLGTENGSACSMARVQSQDGVNFQLSPGDGVNEPCSISFPRLSQAAFLVGQPSAIQLQVAIPGASNVDPEKVQLFAVDSNAQPVGAPLCSLKNSGSDASGDGLYSCSAQFERDTPGTIPLMVLATAGGNTLLSPGFSLLAITPIAQPDVDTITKVTSAASAAWDANYQAMGDTPQARMQTINALAGMGGVQDVRLLEDGVSIGVQFTSGVRYALVLNRLSDAVNLSAETRIASAGSLAGRAVIPAAWSLEAPPDTMPTATCNSPLRPVVKNNNVLIWNSGFFTQPSVSSIAQDQFKAIKCPSFNVLNMPASIANAQLFPNFGTVIIDTHGGPWQGDEFLLTSDPVPLVISGDDPRWTGAQVGGIVIGGAPGHKIPYWGLTPSFFQSLGTFQRTLVFDGACYGARSSGLANVMAANEGAYFGFTDEASAPNAAGINLPGFATTVEPILLDHLLNQYMTVADAFASQDVSKTDPSVLASLSQSLHIPLSNVNAHLVLLTDPSNKLAYLGNPSISGSAGAASPYTVMTSQSVTLMAQLQGAVGCNSTMSYVWKCPANFGNLTGANGSDINNFTSILPTATYKAAADSTGGSDDVMVDFLPDGRMAIPARGCATVNVQSPYFAVIGNEIGVPMTVSGSPGPNNHWVLQLQTVAGALDKSGSPESAMLMVEFDSVPPAGFYSADSHMQVVSVNASAMYQGRQYGMSCPPFTSTSTQMCAFSVRLEDVSHPSTPLGEAAATVFAPNNFNASINFFFQSK